MFEICWLCQGNLLGAGEPQSARLTAQVALACASIMGFGLAFVVMLHRRQIAGLFVDDEVVVTAVVDLMPLTILYSAFATLGAQFTLSLYIYLCLSMSSLSLSLCVFLILIL